MAVTVSSTSLKQDRSWDYSGVKLTIHNIIIPEERLCPTPSQYDKMDPELEVNLRMVGCELIQDSGVLLKLPQVAMATAQVLYQRFFYSKSFVRHFYEHYAMACVFLAAKLEECPRRIRDIINVFHHIRQLREHNNPTPVMLDQSYSNLKNQIIKAERRLLKELGFCVHAKHPHKLIICYLQALGQESNSALVQTSWNYMNDSLRTDLFVRYLPEAIACACIYLASCKLEIPLPRHPAWWEMFTVDEESVHEIALCLIRLYARPKPNVTELEAELARLRKGQLEAKEREIELKKSQLANTPSSLATDHDVSPTAELVDKVVSLPKDREPEMAKAIKDVDINHSLPPNSILANALATAKVVAASIAMTKTADNSGSSSTQNFDITDDPMTAVSLTFNQAGTAAKRSRHSTGSRSHKHGKRKNNDISGSSGGRPAAYPNVVPQEVDESRQRKKEMKYRNKQYSRHSASVSPSTSTSSVSGDAQPQTVPPSAYALSRPRQYRHHRGRGLHGGDNPSTSGSGSQSNTPSPFEKRKSRGTFQNKKFHKNRSRSRSSDNSDYSSFSSTPESRHGSHTRHKKSSHGSYRRVSPHTSYSLDKIQDPSTNGDGKLRLPNGIPRDNRNYRHDRSSSSKRHRPSSHEHRRR